MAGRLAVGVVLTRVDSRAERMVLMGVGVWAGEMAMNWFNWMVDWMAGCLAGRKILTRDTFVDKLILA